MVIGRAKGSSKDGRRILEGSPKDERRWLPAAFIGLGPRRPVIEVHAQVPEEARIIFTIENTKLIKSISEFDSEVV